MQESWNNPDILDLILTTGAGAAAGKLVHMGELTAKNLLREHNCPRCGTHKSKCTCKPPEQKEALAEQIVNHLLEGRYGFPRYMGPNPRTVQILKMRDEEGLAFAEIAARFGVSMERIRRIYLSAKHRLGPTPVVIETT